MQRRLGVDVLVSGHTHQLQVGQNDVVHPPSSVVQNSHCKAVSSAIIICIGEVATMTAASEQHERRMQCLSHNANSSSEDTWLECFCMCVRR